MEKPLQDLQASSNKLRQEEFSIMVQQAMLEEEFLPEMAYLHKKLLQPRPEAVSRLMDQIHADMEAPQPQV